MVLLAGAGKDVGVVNWALSRKGKECCLTANVSGAWLSSVSLVPQSCWRVVSVALRGPGCIKERG